MTENSSAQFEYETVDPAALPVNRSGGRTSENPHRSAVQQVSGTGKTLAFTISAPPEQENRDRIVRRHVRWLRAAATELGRSVRTWHEQVGEDRVRISFQDRPSRPRARPTVDDGAATTGAEASVSDAATAITAEAATPVPAFTS